MKKLIEVSLPLEAINLESAREKSIRHGHPSTLHLWWARRPLAACRAVLWSSLVDDPSGYMPDEASANEERERLFRILEKLVLWGNINNEDVLDEAKLEIARSVARNLGVDMPVGKEAIREFLAEKAPPVLDPFAGGGSIPLEAQRLGLRAYASDLNPVAVLINKALIEIPPKFAGLPPVHPPVTSDPSSANSGKKGKKAAPQAELWTREWKGAQGLAEDVRYYGQWMRDEAEKRIGYLYPKAKITTEILAERPDLKAQGLKPGDELTVIAWLWARTVKCPNPACGAQMPLIRSYWLSNRKGTEAWMEPIVDKENKTYSFKTHTGKPLGEIAELVEHGTKLGRGANFGCIVCNNATPSDYIRNEGQQGKIGQKLIAMVLEGSRKRIYLTSELSNIIDVILREDTEDIQQELADDARAITVKLYGYKTFDTLFSNRQITSLIFLSNLLADVHNKVKENSGGNQDYATAIVTYLAFALDKAANYWSTLCGWHFGREIMMSTLGRNALPMIWDYAEANPLSNSSGNWIGGVEQAAELLENILSDVPGKVFQQDAATGICTQIQPMISSDPPYYDNVPYSDVADYFYVWLRRSLKAFYPDLFHTMLTPKSPEIVAFSYRFGGDNKLAESHFEKQLGLAFEQMYNYALKDYPITIYYAFKQQENADENNTASTGWEKMLEGLSLRFQIIGTWPMRTEQEGGLRLVGRNSLATSIILVCRPRSSNADSISRREFLATLKKELAPALRQLQKGNIAPVDFAQAAIGPGMAVFSRYAAVLEADGSPMRVRAALGLINQSLDEFLTEQEGEYDSDTRWALAWYEQFGHNEAAYGIAETLSKAKNTSVQDLVEAGMLEARSGKVRLLRRDELNTDWNPQSDKRLTAWEAAQHLIYALDKQGEAPAAALLGQLGGLAETIRDLAYRLYTLCERKSWAQDALAYNMLVVAWPRLKELAARKETPGQGNLL